MPANEQTSYRPWPNGTPYKRAKAISSTMHVFGAMGISRELGLERSYRDIRMLPIPDGTYEVLTLIAGREITGIPAYRA